MPDDQKNPPPPATTAVTPPPATTAVPVFTPKIGQMVLYTETDARSKALNTYPMVITAIGSTTAPKKDKDGKAITETVQVKTTSKGTIPVTRNIMENVANYDGVYFSANQQFPVSKRGVLIDVLAPVGV